MATPYAFDEHQQVFATERSTRTLTSRILLAASRTPDASAVISGVTELSYRQLIESANHVAMQLRGEQVTKEEPIAILATREAEFIVAIIGVMLAGCCYVPVDPAMPPARLRQVAKKANIRILLGSPDSLASISDITCVRIAVTHRAIACREWIDDAVEAGLAYQLFTSGSTGTPKLVAIEHRSVCALLDGFNDVAGVTNHASVSTIAPFSFDASVWEIFSALTSGGVLHILPGRLARDPEKLASYIAENCISTAYIPPAVLDTFIDEISDAGDPVALQCVMVGVEPILQSTLQRLRDKYPALRIINAYGPTEATVCSTLFSFTHASDPSERTPIGWAVPGWEVLVVDERFEPVKNGEVGEILVGGIGLARGYIGTEDANAKFIIRQCSGRFYRTGDLARILPTGALEFIGRQDQQVKIRGFRVEPVEIENALMRHPDVTRAIAIVTGNVDARRLYAFAESSATVESLRRHIEKLLPEYLQPSRIISLARFPVTTHGKIDKPYLLSQARKRPLNYPLIEATNSFENALATAWREVLDIEDVGITDNFFELGGDSMLALVLAKRLSTVTGMRTGSFLAYQTIAAAASALQNPAVSNCPPHVASMDYENQPTPLSFGQEGLWTFQKLHPGNLGFILPVAIRIQGDIPLALIQQALVKLMQRHEIFRVEYAIKTRKLVQIPAAKALPINFASTSESGDRLHLELAQLFLHSAKEISKLDSVPVRINVLRMINNCTVILFAFHHIVIDGSSIALLVADITRLIGGDLGATTQIAHGPRYFACIQRSQVGGDEWNRMKEHWCRRLTPLPKVLALSSRNQVDKYRSGSGSWLEQVLPEICVDAMGQIAKENGTTIFTVVLAAIAMLAHRMSRQRDFVISTPFSMRHQMVDVGEAIGYFVNILPLRFQPTAAMLFSDYLRATQKILRDAQMNGAFPFEAIVQSLGLSHQEALSLSRLVVVQEMPSGLPFKSAEAEFHGIDIRQKSAMYELAVFVPASFDGINLRWEFDNAVFNVEAIQSFQLELEKILTEATTVSEKNVISES